MTPAELRVLCQTLRAEGVKRVRLSPEGKPLFVEFYPQAAAIPTDEERGKANAAAEPATGFETALTLLRTGTAPTGGDA